MPTLTRFNDDGVLIAELVYRPSSGATCEFHLDVYPPYQRQGIGRSLVAHLEQIGQGRKWMSLYSFCAADNLTTILFFQALEFRCYPADDFYGEGRDGYFLWKPIGVPT